jgi:hypothetical protein
VPSGKNENYDIVRIPRNACWYVDNICLFSIYDTLGASLYIISEMGEHPAKTT